MQKSREWLGRLVRVLLPVLVSVLAILWVRSKLDFGQVWSVLQKMHWQGLVIHGLVMLVGLVLRALSFSAIMGKRFSKMASFHGMNAGYLLNNILPFRLGEFGRAGLLASYAGQDVSFLEVFGAIITERTLDLVIGVVFFLVGLFLIETSIVPVWIAWLALVLLLAFMVLVTLGAKHRTALIARWRERHAGRAFMQKKLLPWLSDLLKGFDVFLQPGKLALAGFLLLLSWFAAFMELYMLQTELMTGAQWWWPFVVLTAGVFINALPSAPSGIGVYEFGVVWAYTMLGADAAEGLAIALVMHVYQFVIPSVLGLIGIYALGENLSNLVTQARVAQKESAGAEQD